jgi:RNA polymerase sigma-70 factor, ECF subfamily
MECEMAMDNTPTNQAAGRFERNQTALAPSTEANLVFAAQHGDLSAFNELVLAHQDGLYRWVVSLVQDEALADDITQLVFISAYQKISTFRGGSLRAWLFQIARNRSYDILRQQKHRPTVRLDDDPQDEQVGGLLSVLPSTDPSPEEALIQAEQASQLLRLLNSLPAPFRQVLELVDLNEMDYQQAADVLGLPLGTVKSRVVRARLKLRDMLVQQRGM